MKFGKLDNIEGIDFTLPPDHRVNQNFNRNEPDEIRVYSGGTMWGMKQWKGTYFPEKAPVSSFGEHYCKQFGCIELNATHYRIHPPETISKWKAMAPSDFKFCPKWPQLITHYRRFTNSEGLTDEFLNAISHFEENLGPCFIQLPPNYTTKYADRLKDYLASLPRDIEIALELRHPSWFDSATDENIWEFLSEHGIGSVISDTAGRRDAVHMALTAPFVVLRFGAYELHPSDNKRWQDWIDRITEWKKMGMQSFYLLMHQPDSILTPESCAIFGEMVEEQMGIKVKSPQRINLQGDLFP